MYQLPPQKWLFQYVYDQGGFSDECILKKDTWIHTERKFLECNQPDFS